MSSEDFIKKIDSISKAKKSKLILAIDDANHYSKVFLEQLREYSVGIKIGLTCLLEAYSYAERLNYELSKDFVTIADLKIADVQHICEKIGKLAKKLNFDAVIAHTFIGESSLKALNKVIPTLGIVAMTSHDSIKYDENLEYFVEICNNLSLAGIIAPATKPDILKRLRSKTHLKIFSPGIGAQGMKYGSAIKNGADYEIVGRSIFEAKDYISEAKKAVELQWIS
jgi:orotidine 5''-phosphate decarboxylase, subfamily 1